MNMNKNSEMDPMEHLNQLYKAMNQARTAWYVSHGQPDAVRHALGQQWDICETAWRNEYRRLEASGVQITDEAFA